MKTTNILICLVFLIIFNSDFCYTNQTLRTAYRQPRQYGNQYEYSMWSDTANDNQTVTNNVRLKPTPLQTNKNNLELGK